MRSFWTRGLSRCTRAGTLDVAIPKLRAGSYFPDWLLERRRRAERALTTVVATCYLLGVSTRRMEKLVVSLGITRLSKSQVSEMARAPARPSHSTVKSSG
jgi:putative transposase